MTSRPFAAGESGNFYSQVLDATPDGRFLLMYTGATNLVAAMADTNGLGDLLVYDRETSSFDWITTHHLYPDRPAFGESLQGSISDDGRFVAFSSGGRQHAPGTTGQSILHVYLCDRQTHTTVKVSHAAGNPLGHGNGTSWQRLLLSSDGRYLAYESDATNLVAGADANNGTDVFQYDRTTGVNTLVSHSTSGPNNAAERRSTLAGMSADGRYVPAAHEREQSDRRIRRHQWRRQRGRLPLGPRQQQLRGGQPRPGHAAGRRQPAGELRPAGGRRQPGRFRLERQQPDRGLHRRQRRRGRCLCLRTRQRQPAAGLRRLRHHFPERRIAPGRPVGRRPLPLFRLQRLPT